MSKVLNDEVLMTVVQPQEQLVDSCSEDMAIQQTLGVDLSNSEMVNEQETVETLKKRIEVLEENFLATVTHLTLEQFHLKTALTEMFQRESKAIQKNMFDPQKKEPGTVIASMTMKEVKKLKKKNKIEDVIYPSLFELEGKWHKN